LAAQPLVKESYSDPLHTFMVNTMGTAYVIEAARKNETTKAVLCITTDKVYENDEMHVSFIENDRLGGKDPYSASKASAEIIIKSLRDSFGFKDGLKIASARGGNIIGGGDWSDNRIIPDIIRSIINNEKLTIRSPNSVRPWQHVLGLVHGYLILSANLIDPKKSINYEEAWNFGPLDQIDYSVLDIINLASAEWDKIEYYIEQSSEHEAGFLKIDSTKSNKQLDWIPCWDTKRTIIETFNWYKQFYIENRSPIEITSEQIDSWRSLMKDI